MKDNGNRPLETRATPQPGLSVLTCSNRPPCPVSHCHLLTPSGQLQREFGIARLLGCGCQHTALIYRGYCPCPGHATNCRAPRAAGGAHPAVPRRRLGRCPARHGAPPGPRCDTAAPWGQCALLVLQKVLSGSSCRKTAEERDCSTPHSPPCCL